MEKRVLFLILLIATPVFPRRSSSGGGNFNRGSSGARGNVPPSGGFNQGVGGFNQGGGGGFRPQPAPGGGFNNGGFSGPRPNPQPGFNSGGGFRPSGPGSFQPSGVGSRASSGSWKTALAAGALGAVGGVVAWEAGKAIIRSANEPFNHGGRNYYWDNNYKAPNGMMQCSMPLSELQSITAGTTTTTTTTTVSPVTTDPNASTTTTTPAPTADNILNNIQFSNGERPKTVTWGCKQGSEVCCGTECCPAPPAQSRPSGTTGGSGSGSSVGTILLLIVIFFLLLCCCGCFIIYKCFGGLFDSCRGENKREQYDQGQGEYPMQQYGQQPNYSQPQHYDQNQYPPQPQYNQGYPPQPQYPNQYNPNQYPAYPPHPQY